MVDFIEVLNKAARGSGQVDVIKWIGDTSGCYKPKSFCISSQSPGALSDKLWKLVWRNLAPPKGVTGKQGLAESYEITKVY
ncbi:hypothetical protein V6N13_046937 [Hibiscus sabdariffa]